MLTRGGPCARGCSFDRAWCCEGPWARSLDDRTSFQFLLPNRNPRRSKPSDRLAARLVRWRPLRRIAYLAWADRVRRSIVSLDTTCAAAQGGVADEKATGVKGRAAYRKFMGD